LKYLSAQREKMSPMVRSYWAEFDQVKETGQPVVFCLGMIPQELFRTIDCSVFFGENFGAACAVARVSQELCEVAESKGFPMELCSYVRTNLGALATGRNPMGKALPKPDIIAYCNGRCTSYAGWGKALKEMYPDADVVAVDVPPLRDGMSADEYRDAQRYVVQQIEDVIGFLDGWRGRRFDRDRLAEAVGNTGKGGQAFVALQETLRTNPAPISLIDIFFQLFPMVCLKGRPEIAEYYSAAKAEVDQRIAEGFSAVPDEKYRIYWDGIAIWTRLSNQFQQLARHGATLVSSVYAYNMADSCAKYDASRPVESLADGLLNSFINKGLQAKIDYVSRLVTDFDASGIIMQVSRSCKPFFLDEYSIMKGVIEKTGVPYCEVHGDMADPRLYSEQEIENRIEAFLTRLAS
jgi:benzoyl-CoA reductase/2-hydroxyglutaryl-CoA dehydratase subunit BcrC/BadD/HgdB